MASQKLTARSVEAVLPGSTDLLLWDTDLRGFGVKVTKGGSKVYVVQYRMGGRGSPTRRVTIGKHGSRWTTMAARQEAERLLIRVKTGVDPQQAREQQKRIEVDLAFATYAERFITEYGQRNWKPRTLASASSALRRWAVESIGRKSLPSLRRTDITAALDRIPSESPALKRSVAAYLSRLFTWAVARGDIDKSPMEGMDRPRAVDSRERTLDDRELTAVLGASLGMPHPFGPFVRLLLLTGQRRDEVARMRWEELDRKSLTWVLPKARTKNSREHRVALSSVVMTELDSLAGGETWPAGGWVITTTGRTPISGFSRMKIRLDREIGALLGHPVSEWRLHDLRRSMATNFQRLGVRFEVTETVLNHISGAKAGVAGVYQRHNWVDESRTALQLWADSLLKMITGEISSFADVTNTAASDRESPFVRQ